MRMQNGTFRISMPPYGYRYDASGSLAIEPSEAAIVQEIFAAFLNGTNIAKIAEAIQVRGVPKLRGECKWSKHGIRYILTNERYMGDQRFRKSFRTDTLPYKKVDNRGQMPQFYMASIAARCHSFTWQIAIRPSSSKRYFKRRKPYLHNTANNLGMILSSMIRPGQVCCTALYAKRRSITARSTVGNAGSVPGI